MENKYSITYRVDRHDPPLTKDEIPEDHGATHAVIIISQLYLSDGSYSQAVVSLDGRTGDPVSSDELFKAWTLMSGYLGDCTDLSEGKRMFAVEVFETFRAALEFAASVSEETH